MLSQKVKELVMGPLGTLAAVTIALSASVPSAAAVPVPGSELLVGRDSCSGQLFSIKPDGSSRAPFASAGRATDVSRHGPLTALVTQRAVLSDPTSPVVLWAIDVATGTITTLISGYAASDATFSPDAGRIAYVRFNDPNTPASADLYIADVVRDGSTQAVTGLANTTRVVDLLTIGARSDTNASNGFYGTGGPEFSRDGNSIVAVIYDDLWRIDFAGAAMTAATAVTRTKTFAERAPHWSPAGRDVIAFSGAAYSSSQQFPYVAVQGADLNIYALDILSATTRAVITKQNRGQAGDMRDTPSWSPDATFIAFSAFGPTPSRKSTCGGVNTDIFKIRADGSGSANNVTMTTGTGIENNVHWGWQ